MFCSGLSRGKHAYFGYLQEEKKDLISSILVEVSKIKTTFILCFQTDHSVEIGRKELIVKMNVMCSEKYTSTTENLLYSMKLVKRW